MFTSMGEQQEEKKKNFSALRYGMAKFPQYVCISSLFREAVLQALSHCAEVKYHLENLILGNMYLLNAKLNQIKEQMIFLKF